MTTLKQQLENEYNLKDFLARRCNKCLKALNCSLVKEAKQGLIQSGLVLGTEQRDRCEFEVIQCGNYRPCLPSAPKKACRRKNTEDSELFPHFEYSRKWG